MVSADVLARLAYLSTAGQLLRTSAPATSATIQSQYDKTAIASRTATTPARRKTICGYCGHEFPPDAFFTPESTSSAIRTSSAKRRSRMRDSKEFELPATNTKGHAQGHALIGTCKECRRTTRLPFSKSHSGSGRKNRIQQHSERPVAKENARSASDKSQIVLKRKSLPDRLNDLKVRGAREAILAETSGLSQPVFDLMDFMKSV